MSRYVDTEYIKAVMLNDRLMQGNAEFTLYAQQVETQVNALPSIEIIRCGECKRANYELSGVRCGLSDALMGEDGFCSIGEREGE